MRNYLTFAIASLALGLQSCDDSTDTLGGTLIDDFNTVSQSHSTYSVATNTIFRPDVVSRGSTGFLGKIMDYETNSYITCNYMTQMRPFGSNTFYPIDSLTVRDGATLANTITADSCILVMASGEVIGDTLRPMTITAHELETPYKETETYTSSFDPVEEGMVRTAPGSLHAQASIQGLSSVYISIPFNDSYTDKEGNTYNNYGTYLLRKFYTATDETLFSNWQKFINRVCPGFYIEVTNDADKMIPLPFTHTLQVFHNNRVDTVYHSVGSLYGSDEVIRHTTILQDTEKTQNLTNDQEATYLKTPAGLFTEIELPIADIVLGKQTEHVNDSLSTVRLFMQRLNNATDKSVFETPSTILMVPEDSLTNFFNESMNADNTLYYTTSFTSGNTLISAVDNNTNGYLFSNISALIMQRISEIEKYASINRATLSTEDYASRLRTAISTYTASHPTWNKVILVPVEVDSNSSKTTYTIALNSTRLVRGTEANGKVVLDVVYSKFGK